MTTNNTDNQGWVRLYRKSLDSRVWHNPHLWQLWCYCLLRANHKPCWASVKTGRGQTEVYLEPGQFIFGRFSTAKDLKAKPDATYKRLLKLKTLGNITTQNRTHFTVVTLCNWDLYQNAQADITTQVPPKYHPSNTDKNDKNDKKINKYSQNSNEFRLASLLFDEIRKRKSDFKEPNLQQWSVHIDRAIRIDSRKPDRIEAVIRWCQQDAPRGERGFGWQDNILSTAKLREKFDKLELAMQASQKQRQPRVVKFEDVGPSVEFLKNQLDGLLLVPEQKRTPKDRAEIKRLQARCERAKNDRANADKAG